MHNRKWLHSKDTPAFDESVRGFIKCICAGSTAVELKLTLSHMNIRTQKLIMPMSTAVSCSCAPYCCHKEYLVMLLKYRL